MKLDKLRLAAPDLVLLDDSVNDMYYSSSGEQDKDANEELRATYEILARELRQLSAAVVLLSLLRSSNMESSRMAYGMQEMVYHPVCQMYGMALVSYRDAIWPIKGVHPPTEAHLYDHAVFLGGSKSSQIVATAEVHYLCGCHQAATQSSQSSGLKMRAI